MAARARKEVGNVHYNLNVMYIYHLNRIFSLQPIRITSDLFSTPLHSIALPVSFSFCDMKCVPGVGQI